MKRFLFALGVVAGLALAIVQYVEMFSEGRTASRGGHGATVTTYTVPEGVTSVEVRTEGAGGPGSL